MDCFAYWRSSTESWACSPFVVPESKKGPDFVRYQEEDVENYIECVVEEYKFSCSDDCKDSSNQSHQDDHFDNDAVHVEGDSDEPEEGHHDEEGEDGLEHQLACQPEGLLVEGFDID